MMVLNPAVGISFHHLPFEREFHVGSYLPVSGSLSHDTIVPRIGRVSFPSDGISIASHPKMEKTRHSDYVIPASPRIPALMVILHSHYAVLRIT